MISNPTPPGPRRDQPPAGLLTSQEVARRLAISVRTLYRLIEQGIMPPPIRFSRKLIRWRARDVARCLHRLAEMVG